MGQGGYAAVLKAQHIETGEVYGLKVVPKGKLQKPRDRKRLALELQLMREMPPSPFLMQCHMAFESDADVFFCLDLVNGGDLFFHLVEQLNKTNWGFSEQQVILLGCLSVVITPLFMRVFACAACTWYIVYIGGAQESNSNSN